MKHIPITAKFFSIITTFALFCLGATWFATSRMQFIDNTHSELAAHQGSASVALARSNRAIWAMRANIAEMILSTTEDGTARAERKLVTQRGEFVGLMDTSSAALPSSAATFTELKQAVLQAVDQTCAATILLGRSNDSESFAKAQAAYDKDCSPTIDNVSVAVRSATDTLLNQTKVASDATSDLTTSTIRTTWALILAGLLLVVATGYFAVTTWISKPLTTLAHAMSGIAEGDYGIAIAGDDRKDEIGIMARVAQMFKATGTEKIALQTQAERERRTADEARTRAGEEQKQIAAQQVEVVESLANGLEHMARGNLLFRLDQAFAPDYEKLRSDFNGAITKLQDTMVVISGVTSAIRSGTAEISSASDDLSRRTEQQAASLEETAAALDEITATVKKTSDGSIHARTVVSNTKADAERSGTVVGQAIEAMSAIEQSAQKVTQIIGVIDEIAFQTNLLALNAGVEAARAGEAGRGFAVVASEVRALAQRSAEAAKEIKALISTSSQQVSTGVDLVNETGDALKRIVSQVAEINAVVSDIATSTQEQATALQEVNTAINQMDQVTQQNAAMVEQSTAASKNLASETEQLGRLVGQFELGQKAGGGRSPAIRSQVRSTGTTVAALKSSGRGGAARQPEPATQSWEEF